MLFKKQIRILAQKQIWFLKHKFYLPKRKFSGKKQISKTHICVLLKEANLCFQNTNLCFKTRICTFLEKANLCFVKFVFCRSNLCFEICVLSNLCFEKSLKQKPKFAFMSKSKFVFWKANSLYLPLNLCFVKFVFWTPEIPPCDGYQN